MCGIIGVLNGEKTNAGLNDLCNYVQQGSIVGVLRGDDSTGMMQLRKDHVPIIHKMPYNGHVFAENRRSKAMFNNVDNSLATIVHNRAATHGSVRQDNCHPFEHETDDNYIVGVHNGTVGGFAKREDGIDFEVDSDWLYYQIIKHGAEKALTKLQGAYALVWYEAKNKKMHIATNGQRELHWAYVKDKNAMIIASEHAMLYWLAKRNGIQFEEILYPKKGSIYEFDFADLRNFTTQEVEVAEPAPFVHQQQGRSRTGPTRTTDSRAIPGTSTDGRMKDLINHHKSHTDIIGIAGASKLVALGAPLNSDVEFFPNIEGMAIQGAGDIYGDVLTRGGRLIPAIMPGITGIIRYNMARAKSAEAEVYAWRQLYNDDNRPVGLAILLRSPKVIVPGLDNDDGMPGEDDETLELPVSVTDLFKDECSCIMCKTPLLPGMFSNGTASHFGEEDWCDTCLSTWMKDTVANAH